MTILSAQMQNDFPTRAAMVTARAAGWVPVNGVTYMAGGLSYRGQTGATAIPDLPGLVPIGGFTPQHFGALANGTADDGPATTAMFLAANGRECVFPAGTYNYPAPAGYDVYLFAGGGNMAGENEGPITFPADSSDPRILIVPFTSPSVFGPVELAVEPLKFPYRTPAVAATSIGPALRFAKHMLETTPSNRGIIIVPVASSGTSLVSGSALWAVGNTRYNLAVSASNAAMAYGTGVNRFRGIVWQQGESDAQANVSGEAYIAALAATIAGWRGAITGAQTAILTILGPVPEWEALGLGTTAEIYAAQRNCYKHIPRSSFRQMGSGNASAPDAPTFNRAGSRLNGYDGGLRLQMFASPAERTAFYFAPDNSRAKIEWGAQFQTALPRNVIREQVNEMPSASAKRELTFLWEDNDEYRWRDAFGQWDTAPVPANRPRNFAAFSKYWPASTPINAYTTMALQSVGAPGGTNMLNALATLTIALGEQIGWGACLVVSNGENLAIPEGNPPVLLGLEIDMQPCKGTFVKSGAGLLVNNFVDPVNFGAIGIVADAGGEWLDGIFLQNIARNMIYSSQTLSCQYGLNLNGGTFTEAAISIGVGRKQRFTAGGGLIAAEVLSSADRFLNWQLEAGMRIRGRSPTTEAEAALVLETREPNFTQFAIFRSATGTNGNSAAAALTIRANSTTSRSINAGGTVNSSGADYAEYECKAAGVGLISKGQIVGFDAEGRLTDRWDDAISFAVKSTNPSIVGGDIWAADAGEEPFAPEYICPVGPWNGGDRPMVNSRVRPDNTPMIEAGLETTVEDIVAAQEQWDADWAAWEADCQRARDEWATGPEMAAHAQALADWEQHKEQLRAEVDRIAYCGKVPVNVFGAAPGQWVIPTSAEDGGITARLVDDADLTFADHKLAVGRVRRVLDDGRAEIAVKAI